MGKVNQLWQDQQEANMPDNHEDETKTPIKMTKKARAGARRLAVTYALFTQACTKICLDDEDGDFDDVAFFGKELLEYQKEMGIHLQDEDNINAMLQLNRLDGEEDND